MTKQEREEMLVKTIAKHTQIVLKTQKIAFPTKVIFPARGDYRKRRQARKKARIDILIIPALAASNIAQIIACPPDSDMNAIEMNFL